MPLREHLKDTYIVFLDFDGVLNHINCHSETNFLPEAIETLNQLYAWHPYEIVLCTTWRNSYLFQDLCTLLSKSGIKAPVIDKTPEYTGPYPSINFTDCTEQTLQQIPPNVGPNAEILSYIRRYQINHWVVLDDAPYQHPLVQTHHVQTNSYFDEINGGLRKTHLPQIQQILEREELHA